LYKQTVAEVEEWETDIDDKDAKVQAVCSAIGMMLSSVCLCLSVCL